MSLLIISLIAISVTIEGQLIIPSLASEIAELNYSFNVTLREFDETVSPDIHTVVEHQDTDRSG
jgi:hypothetical protein